MKRYRVYYTIRGASAEYQFDEWLLVNADSKADAMQKGINYLIAERERWGYICDYDEETISVCYHNGNLCETYTDFTAEAVGE